MCTHSHLRIALMIACVTLMRPASTSHGEDGPVKGMLEWKLHQAHPMRYQRRPGTGSIGWRLLYSATDDGKKFLLLEVGRDGYSSSYPELKEGDILPMFGYMFKVRSVHPGTRKDYDAFIEVRWVESKDLPLGIGVARDSLIVPVYDGQQGNADVEDRTIMVTGIDLKNGEASASTTVHCKEKREADTRLRKGDSLLVGDKRFKVRNVVPPDKTHHVIGWLELLPPAEDPPPKK